ncbi:HAD-IA family hydrolase [Devosia sp. BSSL-BM10]|uniref:HAD-IA family hydrolase n=1 Tax=Devosia litorisediminis TaxID=2829817 RepID=A0A942EAV6_9HYPH|nr:HAD-IA family hydrolase [Devosia litorisediminis]
MTRAVFFDVDGVLVHGYHARPEAQQHRWNANLQAVLGIDPERFHQEFIYDIFMKKVIIGQTSLVEALERRLPALGYNGSPMTMLNYWLSHDSAINQPVLDVVRQLGARSDLRLYIATNQEHLRANWLWSHLGFAALFEDIFYSARIGALKPHQDYFDFIEKRIGPQTEPPLLFDDTPKVIDGARRAGWEAIQFDTVQDLTRHPWIAARLD